MSDEAFSALVAHARTVCDAREWLYELNQLERELICSTAGVLSGTEPIRPDTVTVRRVFDALRQPSVLLGEGTCAYCGLEEVDGSCPIKSCESNWRRPTSRDRFGARNR